MSCVNFSARMMIVRRAKKGHLPRKTVEELLATNIQKAAEKRFPGVVIWGAERQRRGGSLVWVLKTPNGPRTLEEIERDQRFAA